MSVHSIGEMESGKGRGGKSARDKVAELANLASAASPAPANMKVEIRVWNDDGQLVSTTVIDEAEVKTDFKDG